MNKRTERSGPYFCLLKMYRICLICSCIYKVIARLNSIHVQQLIFDPRQSLPQRSNSSWLREALERALSFRGKSGGWFWRCCFESGAHGATSWFQLHNIQMTISSFSSPPLQSLQPATFGIASLSILSQVCVVLTLRKRIFFTRPKYFDFWITFYLKLQIVTCRSVLYSLHFSLPYKLNENQL